MVENISNSQINYDKLLDYIIILTIYLTYRYLKKDGFTIVVMIRLLDRAKIMTEVFHAWGDCPATRPPSMSNLNANA